MQQEVGTFCPFIKEECIQFKCAMWTQLRGTHPQTGKEIDEWACAIAWLPVLLVETAKETRQGAAATESLRNELLLRTMQEALVGPSNQVALTGPRNND